MPRQRWSTEGSEDSDSTSARIAHACAAIVQSSLGVAARPSRAQLAHADGARATHSSGQTVGTPISAKLDVFALGQVVVRSIGLGTGTLGFDVLQVEIVDITPDPLESLVECLVLTLLRAVLSTVSLPFSSIRVDAFSLNLLRGPLSQDDQLKLYGSAV